jgi:hypothetical protein
MKRTITTALVLAVAAGWSATAFAARTDAIWARKTTEVITLDGVLNEPGWSKAESMVIRFGIDNGIPGSGWKIESGVLPNDSTVATIRLLVKDNQLYMGATVPDKSIGGSSLFNRFDGFLMSIKDHLNGLDPKPPAEYFYTWWNPEVADPQSTSQQPNFVGRWGSIPIGSPRDSAAIANWDAVTVVNGTVNSDAVNDVGYTVEMRFNLTPMGYDVTQAAGDIVEWNLDIYDCDWFWPLNVGTFFTTRTWWQSPWGNQSWYNQVRVHAKPSVTVNSGPVLPPIQPETFIPDAAAHPAPTINGTLAETAWNDAFSLDIRYGDVALRNSYPGVGRYRSGQHQPAVNGGVAAVLDPGDATVKMFTKGNFLYLGFDVDDQMVQYHASIDRWDGFLVTINDRGVRGPDKELLGRRLAFQVNSNGTALARDYLLTMVGAGNATVALVPKAGTTIDTLGAENDLDTGYTAELAINLTALGYPAGLGDRVLFIGVNLLDGDSFGSDYTQSYGTRTWWYREYEGECCPTWAYMAPVGLSDAGDGAPRPPAGYVLQGNYPNPAAVQTIQYSLLAPSRVTLEMYDVAGRLVETQEMGLQQAGVRAFRYDGTKLSAGIYLYQLKIVDPETGGLRAALPGRMIVTR